jgi:hypothetical protein
MTQGIEMNTAPTWGKKLSDALSAIGSAFALIAGIGLALAGVMYLVLLSAVGEGNGRVAIQLTAIVCGGGFFVVLVVIGLSVGSVMAMRHMSLSANAGVQKSLETLAEGVTQNNIRTDATMNALLTLTNNMMSKPQLPQGAQPTQPQNLRLGWPSKPEEPKPETDLVEVWLSEGKGGKFVKHSLTLMNDFVRMQKPTREAWNHGSDSYGPTAKIIAAIDDSPLTPDGNGWAWDKPHREVIHWWRDVLEDASAKA